MARHSRVLAQYAQQFDWLAVSQLVMHEVVRPHPVGRGRAGYADVAPTATLPGAPLRQIQLELAPETPDTAHLCICHYGDPSVPKAWVAA